MRTQIISKKFGVVVSHLQQRGNRAKQKQPTKRFRQSGESTASRYLVTASRITQARLTFFVAAIFSKAALSSIGMLTESRVTESPGTGWRDRGGRFIMHHYAPLLLERQDEFRLKVTILGRSSLVLQSQGIPPGRQGHRDHAWRWRWRRRSVFRGACAAVLRRFRAGR